MNGNEVRISSQTYANEVERMGLIVQKNMDAFSPKKAQIRVEVDELLDDHWFFTDYSSSKKERYTDIIRHSENEPLEYGYNLYHVRPDNLTQMLYMLSNACFGADIICHLESRGVLDE